MPKVDPDILQGTIGLTDEDMLAYFNSLGYEVSWDWEQAGRAVRQNAFSMASVTKLDLLQDVRTTIGKAIEDGLDFKEFAKTFRDRMVSRGWATNEIAPWRLDLAYDQWIQNSYMAGRWKGNVDAPYLKYISTIDVRTTVICRGLDGKVFKRSDPFWEKFYPPNHFRCRARTRNVSQDEVDEEGIEVESSKGKIKQEEVVTNLKKGMKKKVFGYRDGADSLVPGPGFDFNVGEKGFKLDPKKYDKDFLSNLPLTEGDVGR